MFIAKQNEHIACVGETEQECIDIMASALASNYIIEETDVEYQFYGNEYLTVEEISEKEQERIAMLNLTGADVERGIYKAKGMDFDDILAFVMANPPVGLDVKALKIELKANNFYRGNPYVNAVGALLGFTSEQLDRFFETNDYRELST